MLKPSTWENDLPVFTREDIDLYGNLVGVIVGLPDNYGYYQWICVDGQPEFVADPCEFIVMSRPIHRYSR